MPVSTRAKLRATAVSVALFDTAELLEMILVNLSTRDLLFNVNMVCKQWNAAINSPKKIRQVLFLAPMPISSHFQLGRTTWHISETPVANILPSKLPNGPAYPTAHSYYDPSPFVVTVLNPFLLTLKSLKPRTGFHSIRSMEKLHKRMMEPHYVPSERNRRHTITSIDINNYLVTFHKRWFTPDVAHQTNM